MKTQREPNKSISPLFLLMLASALSGCQAQTLTINHGEIAPQDIAYVKPFLGNYRFAEGPESPESQDGIMQLKLLGNRLVLSSSLDMIEPGCDSSIGALETVTFATDDSGDLVSVEADFDLDPGKCTAILGRKVHFNYNRTLTGNGGVYTTTVILDAVRNQLPGAPTQYVTQTRTLYKNL